MSFEWIDNFDAFFFDFDGLLVDSESIHFKAYKIACLEYGIQLPWDIIAYCKIAYTGPTAIRDAIYILFPEFKEKCPDWGILYERKKTILNDLLAIGDLELLPGVEEFLQVLHQAKKKRAVATNTGLVSILKIKEHLPVLDLIPVWITREDYDKPKPEPDSFLKAIEVLGAHHERKIGFEDSLRGYIALKKAGIFPVLIVNPELAAFDHEELKDVCHFENMRVMDLSQK